MWVTSHGWQTGGKKKKPMTGHLASRSFVLLAWVILLFNMLEYVYLQKTEDKISLAGFSNQVLSMDFKKDVLVAISKKT